MEGLPGLAGLAVLEALGAAGRGLMVRQSPRRGFAKGGIGSPLIAPPDRGGRALRRRLWSERREAAEGRALAVRQPPRSGEERPRAPRRGL